MTDKTTNRLIIFRIQCYNRIDSKCMRGLQIDCHLYILILRIEVEMGLVIVNMRFSYNLLILCIVFICIWFFHISGKSNSYYRKLFAGILWMAVVMYVTRLFGICLEDGYLEKTDIRLTVERCLHYFMVAGIYAFYAFFMYSLLDQFHYFPVWRKMSFLSASFGIDILIFTSPWTKLIFYVQGGQVHNGPLFIVMIGVRILYALLGTGMAFSRRRLLPKIFGQSVLLVSIFTLLQFCHFIATGDDSIFYSTLVINLIVLLLALTVVEFYKDNLTGLLNQEAFEQYVEREIGKKNNKAVYLIKLKNYEYLKENCNEIPLKATIKELADCIKEYSKLSSIYYLGNGRFALIVTKNIKFDETDFFERLKERFCVPFDVNGASIHLNLFIAIMNLDSGKIRKSNFRKYFAACDAMRYRSGELIEIINGDSFGVDQLQRYHNIEEAIDRALVENEFKMFYQPIVSTETKKVVSAEALIRLNDRVLGFISPEEFIPISESNGKILEISDFVIDSVFRFVKENDIKELGLEFIEMNLSMIQCMDKNLPDKLQQCLDKYGVDAKLINLEITETATNFDEERLKEQLFRIKKLGFSFSLDDYGTGYSNLVRVLEYPVDVIKLDKTIVWSAFHDHDNFVTLKNLIAMFHDVRRKMVAEGVESEEQMKTLCDLGCDYLQGYYYSKPIGEEEFVRFVEKING